MKIKVNEIKRYYENEKLAREYINSRFSRPLGRLIHSNQVSALNSLIAERKIKNIIDMACGPGRLSKDLTGLKQGYAVDNSKAMLKLAKKNLDKIWKIEKVDAFRINIKEKFDLIYSFRFVRHFDINKRIILYKNFRKLMKKGSYFVFDVPNNSIYKDYSKKYPSPIYDEHWTKESIKRELKDNGFKTMTLIPNIKHFKIQEFISKFSKIRFLSHILFFIIKFIEFMPSKQPYEWIAVAKIND